MFLEANPVSGMDPGTLAATTSAVAGAVGGALAIATGYRLDRRGTRVAEHESRDRLDRFRSSAFYKHAIDQNRFWSFLTAGASVVALAALPVELVMAANNHASQLLQLGEYFSPSAISGFLGATFYVQSRATREQAASYLKSLNTERNVERAVELVQSISDPSICDRAKAAIAVRLIAADSKPVGDTKHLLTGSPEGESVDGVSADAQQDDDKRTALSSHESGLELLKEPEPVPVQIPLSTEGGSADNAKT